MSSNHSEFSEIPKVELVNFSFSPPGPMGWSSAEYETMLEDPGAFLSQHKMRHAEPANGNVDLIELPLKKRKPQEAIMSVEPINEVMQETVQTLTQELQESAEEPAASLTEATEEKAVKKKKGKKPSSKIKKEKDLLIVSETAAEVPETAVQESAPNEEEMIPAASLEAEVTQELSAFEQPITETVKCSGSRAKKVYSYDKLINLFNQIDQGSNQSSNSQEQSGLSFTSSRRKSQEQSGLSFTSSRRKSKAGPSAGKNKVLFLD
jgi:hypothetical protein